ncbi:MAG: biotin/lipoyl-binding protein, partial [Chloroflexi bacterium]|nr:biotin/lipoyl-binding protein [Chloroflexota bacterium]
MGAILGVFKSLALWQLGVLAVVLIGAAGGTYGVYVLASDSGQADLGEDQQFITVQFGDLVNQVSTNGSLIFPERETLTFGSQGTVIEVLVAEGEQVEEGQFLARLDEASVASLEKAVAQARVNLQNAEDALAKAEDPHTPLDLAQAEAKAANARLSLKNAQEAVDEIVEGSVEDDPALSNALNNLSQAVEEWDGKIEEARDGLTTAREGYKVIFKNWLGITINSEETGQDPDTLLDSWGIDLTSLFDPDQETYKRTYGTAPDGPVDDPATLWNEVVVHSWIRLFPGSVSPTCEGEGSSSGGFCVENEFDSAWETYQQARDDLDTVGIQAAVAISDAETAVNAAGGKFDVLRVDVK